MVTGLTKIEADLKEVLVESAHKVRTEIVKALEEKSGTKNSSPFVSVADSMVASALVGVVSQLKEADLTAINMRRALQGIHSELARQNAVFCIVHEITEDQIQERLKGYSYPGITYTKSSE